MSRAQGGSLLIAGFECWPATPLGTYTIASENFGLGDPTALTRAIEQVSLDGERITGRRHSNRLLKLLIVVRASTRQGLDSASGQLETATNQDTWQVQWTPPHLVSEAALPVIYESYRAVTTIEYDVEALDPSYVAGAAFVRAVYIEAPAFPFGKTPSPSTITGTTAILTLDSLDEAIPGGGDGNWSGTGGRATGSWVVDTGDKTQGTGSWSATETGGVAGDSISLTRRLTAFPGGSVDLTAYSSISLDVKGTGSLPTSFTILLADPFGFSVQATFSMPTPGTWSTISAPLSAFTGDAGFHWTQVNQWQFATSPYIIPGGGFVAPTIKLDNLRVLPPSSTFTVVANGGVYKFAGVAGTARTSSSLLVHAASAQTFGSLAVHAAPAEARPDYTPLVPLSVGTPPPYTVSVPNYQGVATGQRYDGTYAVWLGGVTLNGSSARTITITVTGTPGGAVSVSRSITPAADLHNGMLWLGIINLPLRGTPDGTTDLTNGSNATTVTVTISSGNTADRFSDLLVLDVRGPTVIFTDGNSNAFAAIDEPLATTGVGEVYVGTSASSLFAFPDVALISGGPFTLEPGDNLVVVYAPTGAPTVTATFHPRWLSTRNV